MKKSFCILAVSLLISLLTGCTSSNASSRKIWKDIKASELISQQQLSENKTITVGLYIYLFRIQADKLMELGEQISRTDALPVKYEDRAAFSANGFAGCAGDRISWLKIAPILAQSLPEVKKRINLLITENIADDIVIAELPGPVSVIYRWGSATAGIGFDAGRMVLRIKAEPLIGLRQVCRLDVTPVYITGVIQKTKKQPASRANYEFAFESAALNARLQPGQFVLLAPAQMQTDQTGTKILGDIMFYSQSPQHTTNLYLIACSMINNPL
jgi:hypothetical protein